MDFYSHDTSTAARLDWLLLVAPLAFVVVIILIAVL